MIDQFKLLCNRLSGKVKQNCLKSRVLRQVQGRRTEFRNSLARARHRYSGIASNDLRMALRRSMSLAWSSSKKTIFLLATTVPAFAYSLSSFSPCFELKSIAVLSCSNSLTSVSHAQYSAIGPAVRPIPRNSQISCLWTKCAQT